MDTTFLVIFTFSFLFFQRYGVSTMIETSLNVTCIKRERESLLVFRQGLIDESNSLSTWTGVECCEWHGVGCDVRNGHVVKLDLRTPLSFMDDDYTLDTITWLKGKVSPSLLILKHLRYLDLSMNNFSGQNIPEFFGSFKYMEYLNLSYSGFSGVIPPHLGNLSRLQYLDLNLQYSYDIGPLPYDVSLMVKGDLRWVSLLSSIKHLDLSGINIGKHIDWLHPINMLPYLVTLNLASCDINNIPSINFINFTSLNSLDLSSNSINSAIPVWLSNLTTLVHLNLYHNNFHGRIPDSIGTLISLSSLDLSKNTLSGLVPPPFGGLSYLREMNLYDNALSGSIPESIGLLTSLEILDLSSNQLSGNIPTSLGQLSNLQSIHLSRNELSGTIPPSLGHLSNLQFLSLSSNQLSGTLPTSLGQLSNLKGLNVGFNQLVGVVTENHFKTLENLIILFLSHNSLTLNLNPHWIPPFQLYDFRASSCNIGPSFPILIQKSVNLQMLDISNSSIKDRIPEWFDNISSHIQYLYMSHNQISGRLPRFHGYNKSGNVDSRGRTLVLNSNRFEGPLTSFPSDVKILDLSDNLLSGHLPYTYPTINPFLEIVDLRKNSFTGSIPVYLCELHSIQVLDLSHNNFFGILPECLGSLIQLRVMDLTNNTITGDIPSSFGSLSSLESLHLYDNKFEGRLPQSLQNLTSLVTMDLGNNLLTGNIPFWIGKKLPKLKILNLRSNMFKGKIPVELCEINTLQHLNLANNNITGNIPRCFCNLTGMIESDVNFTYESYGYEENIEAYIKGIQLKYTTTIRFLISLDLSSNKISGEIPDVLMNLKALTSLNLSRNEFSGNIPTRIGNLKSMESLDLSTNKLTGRIPPSLASLNFLGYLNLSFNKLSGPVPVGNQLRTFDDPTMYEGNNGLCGFPLLRSCKRNDLTYNSTGDDDSENGSQGLSWFYAGMVPGIVVGFMGFIVSLYYIRSWRVTYFEMIEDVYVSIIVTLARLRRKFF